MVRTSLNLQTDDALRATYDAIRIASETGGSFSTTGHSLGGCLAQITASHYGLRGETFNAYGAARLAYYHDGVMRIVPEGGAQVVNHVRATDLVSAASAHFGTVRVYALEEDIQALRRAGYVGVPLPPAMQAARGVLGAVATLDAHTIGNFTRTPLLDAANEQRYRAHRATIEAYRGDVLAVRLSQSPAEWVIRGYEAVRGAAEAEAERALRQAEQARGASMLRQLAPEALRRMPLFNDADGPARPLREVPQATPAAPAPVSVPSPDAGRAGVLADVRDPAHPDHALYRQGREALGRMCAARGLAPGEEQLERTALSLVAAAKRDPLIARIDDVVPSVATADAPAAQRLFAIYKPFGEAAPYFHIHVDARTAAHTPVEESLQRIESMRRDTAPPPARAQEPDTPSHGARVLA
ncbi:XVIPCD domain-containing protein [Vulcaniibacterium thermophilum]|uniref:XVIPCD domain-containing protein n=2 Tax=Vulcaniibacterium thermophilum TaxID=1169913 RepID=UPI0011B388AA|nr:XVIPCD domain-containing protein [Vulcaniibacterium thermophilum]